VPVLACFVGAAAYWNHWAGTGEFTGKGKTRVTISWHVWGRREIHAVFWWCNLKERNHLDDTGVDETIILKWIL
jgi:hypothetical protein